VTVPNDAAPTHERRTATIIMACVGALVAYVLVTSVAFSLPKIQAALHGTSSQLTWVQDAFVLPMAAMILSVGVFGDVHGRRKVFQARLVLASIGAVVALCGHSIEVVWVGQAFAGLGASALLPTSLAMISHAVTVCGPPEPEAADVTAQSFEYGANSVAGFVA
jgi:MFS family permease